MDLKSKVFIVHDDPRTTRDFSDAERFGRLVFCWTQSLRYDNYDDAIEVMERMLADYQDDDWLICSGSPVLIAYAGSIISKNGRKLRLLIWDGQQHGYSRYEYN